MAFYSLWDQVPTVANGQVLDDGGATDAVTLGMQFSISRPLLYVGCWYYTPTFSEINNPGLANVCGLFDLDTQDVVAGSQDNSPAWSGEVGSGWVLATLAGGYPLLEPSHPYTPGVWYEGSEESGTWYASNNEFWAETGPGANGLTNGPITAPNNAGAINGQAIYTQGSSFSCPITSYQAFNFWIDVYLMDPPSSSGSAGSRDEPPVLRWLGVRSL